MQFHWKDIQDVNEVILRYVNEIEIICKCESTYHGESGAEHLGWAMDSGIWVPSFKETILVRVLCK